MTGQVMEVVSSFIFAFFPSFFDEQVSNMWHRTGSDRIIFYQFSFVESAADPRWIDCASCPHHKRRFCQLGSGTGMGWLGWLGWLWTGTVGRDLQK